jgi:hypothetical protein
MSKNVGLNNTEFDRTVAEHGYTDFIEPTV